MLPHLVMKRLRAVWRVGLATAASVFLVCAMRLGFGPHPIRWSIPVRLQVLAITAILALVILAWTLRRMATTRRESHPRAHIVLTIAAYGVAVAISGFSLAAAFAGASPRNVYPPCLVSAATLSMLKPFRRG